MKHSKGHILRDFYNISKSKRFTLTQQEFAKAIGYSKSQLVRFFNDEEDISDETLKVAEAVANGTFDVSQETPLSVLNEPEATYIGSQIGTFKTKSREFIELSDGHFIMHVPLVTQKAPLQHGA